MRCLEYFDGIGIADIDFLQIFQHGKFVVVLQDIFSPQVFAKQFNEGLFPLLAINASWIRELMLQCRNNIHKAAPGLTCYDIGKALHVLFVTFLKHHVFGIFIPKQRDGVNGCAFQISERHNIAEGLCSIKDTVSARECLHQTVITQVFIDEQSVQRRRVKTG